MPYTTTQIKSIKKKNPNGNTDEVRITSEPVTISNTRYFVDTADTQEHSIQSSLKVLNSTQKWLGIGTFNTASL